MVDLKKVENDGIYQAHAPLGTVLEDLEKVGARMAQVKATRRKLGWSGLACVVLGIALLVIGGTRGVAAASGIGFLFLVTWPVLWVPAFRYGRKLSKHTDRYQLLKELSRLIQQDAAAA